MVGMTSSTDHVTYMHICMFNPLISEHLLLCFSFRIPIFLLQHFNLSMAICLLCLHSSFSVVLCKLMFCRVFFEAEINLLCPHELRCDARISFEAIECIDG